MIYPQDFEQKIGFDQVRQWVREHCLSPLGEDRVDAMTFSDRLAEVVERLEQTREMLDLEQSDAPLPSSHYYDLRPALKRVRPEGTWLDERELHDLSRSLQTIRQIVGQLTHQDGPEQDDSAHSDAAIIRWPRLRLLALDVEPFPQVIKAIEQIISPYGEVRDSASPQLSTIRQQLAATRGSISRLLLGILRSMQAEGLVERDVSPTLRDGRLVIPVSPSLKRRIGGIVHDESASGKTVFVEPAQVVEANNRVRTLQAEERREVVRILTEFTARLRPLIPAILLSYEFLADIDFIRAKALVALDTDSCLPQLSDTCLLAWHQAVHPLLRRALQAHGKQAVPLDIDMDSRQRILVISGPNAGGKSVCLKTVGLLQYMLQSGMLIPVAPGSQAGLFTSLFIDIGDEQSIDNELSTYSSHLTHMKHVLRQADDHSLVLIDEFGGGTEPRIGGAIAQAVLRRLHERGTYVVVTTHYHNLKQFADSHPGVTNCAMLYDRQLMQPLFQLQTGQPGSSFAVEIARKIGLPDDVIAEASELVGSEYIQSDRYLLDIARDKRYWANKRQEIRQLERQTQETLARYQAEAQDLHSQRRDILRQARDDAQQLLSATNARIENTIRTIREAQAERERTRQARLELQQWRDQLQAELLADDTADDQAETNALTAAHRDASSHAPATAEGPAVDPIAQRMERIRARQKRRAARQQQDEDGRAEGSVATSQAGVVVTQGDAVASRGDGSAGQRRDAMDQKGKASRRSGASDSWQEGDAVRLRGQRTVGRVLDVSADGSQVVVAFGQIKTTVSPRRLEAAQPVKSASQLSTKATFVSEQTHDSMRRKQLEFSQQLDVRGMRGDEAVQAVQYYIDDAILVSAERVRILHGTGTGILRTLIRQYLSTVPAVKSYHDEHIQLGGTGITVVEL